MCSPPPPLSARLELWSYVRHLGVVLEGLVRRAGEVQVEPRHPSVVAADDYVVAGGVDVDAADPLAPAHQSLHQHLQTANNQKH